ncbi:MAG TPA: putative toxin-antitoxin system toxin component, PIN family [Mucilaginibacter sp.]|jgi:putative PIN family toxin of toxin-antitoxin system
MNHKFVFDTNVLISAALLGNSINAKALDYAVNIGRIIVSEPVLSEFAEVIFRKKFDKYFLSDDERHEAIDFLAINALVFSPKININACRDPKDNKFLELAIAAEASCIVTGDQDLLVLHPFNGIPIVSAMDFLKSF